MSLNNNTLYQSKLVEIENALHSSFKGNDLQENSRKAIETLNNLKAVIEHTSTVTELRDDYLKELKKYTFYSSPLVKAIFNGLTKTVAGRTFYAANNLQYLDLGKCSKVEGNFISQSSADPKLETLIFRKTDAVVTASSSSIMSNTKIENGEGYIYVPDELVESYKVANNWTVYASQIKGLSELVSEEV